MLRVGGDAHIAPRPDGRDWWVFDHTPGCRTQWDDEGIVPYADGKMIPFK